MLNRKMIPKTRYFAAFGTLCFLFIVFSSYSSETHAEEVYFMKLLETAFRDQEVQAQQEFVDYLNDAPSSTPYVDKIELRSETKDWLLENQKYSLRLYPKGLGETNHTRKLSENRQQNIVLKQKVTLQKALKKRYELGLSLLSSLSLDSLQEELRILLEDRISVMNTLIHRDLDFDITELLRAEDELIELRLTMVKNENKKEQIINEIKQLTGLECKELITASALISPLEMMTQLENMHLDEQFSSLYLEEQHLDITQAHEEYEIEKAKNRDYLSFLELEYDSEESDDPQQAVTFGIAFKLPFINPDREDVHKKKIRLLDEKLDYAVLKRKNSEEIQTLRSSIERLSQQYTILHRRKESGNAEVSFKKYLMIEGIDPLKLLEIKESIIRNDMKLTDITFQLYEKYISLLDIQGLLLETPLTNKLLKENAG